MHQKETFLMEYVSQKFTLDLAINIRAVAHPINVPVTAHTSCNRYMSYKIRVLVLGICIKAHIFIK